MAQATKMRYYKCNYPKSNKEMRGYAQTKNSILRYLGSV